jgi:hypothetical protein
MHTSACDVVFHPRAFDPRGVIFARGYFSTALFLKLQGPNPFSRLSAPHPEPLKCRKLETQTKEKRGAASLVSRDTGIVMGPSRAESVVGYTCIALHQSHTAGSRHCHQRSEPSSTELRRSCCLRMRTGSATIPVLYGQSTMIRFSVYPEL